jgi:hypothetical protein
MAQSDAVIKRGTPTINAAASGGIRSDKIALWQAPFAKPTIRLISVSEETPSS